MNDLIGSRSADLALFARVVEAGGFTAASRNVGAPQTTISRRIAKLERELGVRLLERTTRKVSVTEVGRRIYQNARRIIEEAEGAQAVAATMRDEPAGLIRVSAPVVFGQHLLAPALSAFLGANPKVKVQLDLTGRQVDLVEESIDVAVRIGPLLPSSLIRRRIMWANAAYFANAEIAVGIDRPDALHKAHWLHAGNEHGTVEWKLLDAESLEEKHSFAKEPRVTSSDVETLISCAKAGLGVAVLPEFAVPRTLKRVLPSFVSRQVEINALSPSHKSITPAVRSFLDYLQKKVQAA